jgi:hypothetical protein
LPGEEARGEPRNTRVAVEDRRDDRPAVKCFTCPRERRGDEGGWYFVDPPDRARAYGPARIFVCPRHYGHFAERERGRWTEVAVAPALVPTPAAEWLDVPRGPAEVAVGALSAVALYDGEPDTLASES